MNPIEAPRADLTVRLADGAAPDFKLYVRLVRFSHEEAAALFGVMWQAARPRKIAKVEPRCRAVKLSITVPAPRRGTRSARIRFRKVPALRP